MAITAALLAGCSGGGGGDDSAVASTTTIDQDARVRQYASAVATALPYLEKQGGCAPVASCAIEGREAWLELATSIARLDEAGDRPAEIEELLHRMDMTVTLLAPSLSALIQCQTSAPDEAAFNQLCTIEGFTVQRELSGIFLTLSEWDPWLTSSSTSSSTAPQMTVAPTTVAAPPPTDAPPTTVGEMGLPAGASQEAYDVARYVCAEMTEAAYSDAGTRDPERAAAYQAEIYRPNTPDYFGAFAGCLDGLLTGLAE